MQTITREEMATALGLPIEDVAIIRVNSYSKHITIKGTSYCGRINHDGNNIPTQWEALTGQECATCVKRYKAKAGN